MKNAALLCCSFAAIILSGNTSTYGQSPASTPKPADPRVEQLKKELPENLVSEAAYAVDWPLVHEKDVFWRCRMWRTIDMRDERNGLLSKRTMLFRGTAAKLKNLTQVLMDGAMQDQFNVYSSADDRFTIKLSPEIVRELTAADLAKYPNAAITTFRIKQDWLYIGSEQKLVARIIGIAPVRQVVAADGVTTEEPLFWLYYPDIRKYLREYQLFDPTDPAIKNLDQVFETAKFASTIIDVRTSTAYIMIDGKMMPAGTSLLSNGKPATGR